MIDFRFTDSEVSRENIFEYTDKVKEIHQWMLNVKNDESEFLGWVDLPLNMKESEEFERIKKAAEKIKSDSDILICIGIGGSYLRC